METFIHKIRKFIKTKIPEPIFSSIPFQLIMRFMRKLYIINKLMSFTEPFYKEIKVLGINFSLLLNPKTGQINKEFYVWGIYEYNILKLIYENLSKNDTFVDVGSNIGQYTNFSASLCKQVYGFEPVKVVYEQNLASVKRNNFSNVKLYPYGVGRKDEEKEINIFGDEGISSFFSKWENQKNVNKKELVRVISLDKFIKEKVDLIKIDVEGYEWEVVLGMRKIIEKHQPKIVLEFSPKFYNTIDENIGRDLINFFIDRSYFIYKIHHSSFRELEFILSYNYFIKNKNQVNLFLTPNKL